MKIKITDIPQGEAPEEVRKMWVGLILPLFIDRERSFITTGVLTGPKSWWGTLFALLSGKTVKRNGFTVNSKVAIEILESKSPEAANWWKLNTPCYSNSKKIFIFEKAVCQIVEETD
jgi:hypothetical protein